MCYLTIFFPILKLKLGFFFKVAYFFLHFEDLLLYTFWHPGATYSLGWSENLAYVDRAAKTVRSTYSKRRYHILFVRDSRPTKKAWNFIYIEMTIPSFSLEFSDLERPGI